MTDNSLYNLRFPIGEYNPPKTITPEILKSWIDEIAAFPKQLRLATETLSNAELALVYRPGGWNIRQLVHHYADSHMNAFVRFKLCLTEGDKIVIKPYNEVLWAELPDSLKLPVEPSLQIIEGLHLRWTHLLKTMTDEQWNLSYLHPEFNSMVVLRIAIGSYAWHCKHHLAHIQLALNK